MLTDKLTMETGSMASSARSDWLVAVGSEGVILVKGSVEQWQYFVVVRKYDNNKRSQHGVSPERTDTSPFYTICQQPLPSFDGLPSTGFYSDCGQSRFACRVHFIIIFYKAHQNGFMASQGFQGRFTGGEFISFEGC